MLSIQKQLNLLESFMFKFTKFRSIYIATFVLYFFLSYSPSLASTFFLYPSLDECLLPADHPLQEQLVDLFKNPKMFASASEYSKSGFKVFGRVHRGCMVASHPKISNYLFKKFNNSIPQTKQTENYLARVRGAKSLNAFAKLHDLPSIYSPKKWLYPLPKAFSKEQSYILVVEKINLASEKENRKKYYKIDYEILRELCFVLFHFRGLDSTIENMPFDTEGKIVFLDTERWDWPREGFLERSKQFIRKDRQEYAQNQFKELSTG